MKKVKKQLAPPDSSAGNMPPSVSLGLLSLSSVNIQMVFEHLPVCTLYKSMAVSKSIGVEAKTTAATRQGTPHHLRKVVIQDFPHDVCVSNASEEPWESDVAAGDMDVVWQECESHFRHISYPIVIKSLWTADGLIKRRTGQTQRNGSCLLSAARYLLRDDCCAQRVTWLIRV
jgi:hypothetical protein